MIQPISKINFHKSNSAQNIKAHSNQVFLNQDYELSHFPIAYISFKGGLNSFSNYRNNDEAIKIKNNSPINENINKTIAPVDYAKKSITNIFKQDRDILDFNYWGDTSTYERFSKLGYVEDLLDKHKDINVFVRNTNERKLAKDYAEFYNTTLKSLEKVAKGEYRYTDLFLDKKIGNKNLVDFWLININPNITVKTDKIGYLNNILSVKYTQNGDINDLVILTILEFFKSKLESVQKHNISTQNIKNNNNNLSNIKDRLNGILTKDVNNQKKLLKEIINNSNVMNERINDVRLMDLFLYPIYKDDETILDSSDSLKKEMLNEIVEDNILRRSSIENVLSVLRKSILSTKANEEKQKQASIFIKDEALRSFDKNLLKELFLNNKKERVDAILKDIKLFEKEASKLFNQMIITEPFTINNNNENVNNSINIILSLINNILFNTADSHKANKVLYKLSELSQNLYLDKNMQLANTAWKEIVAIAQEEWIETHIPYLIKEKQKDYLVVENFLRNQGSDDIVRTGIVGTIFNSDLLTIEEKAFLAKKSNLNEFVSFAKFLSEHIPGNIERKKIIDTLMDKESFNIDLFEEIKDTFISDIRAQKVDSLALNNQININNVSKNICDLVIEQIPNVEDSINQYSNNMSKINYLNRFTDEDLSDAFDNLKEFYLKDKFVDNCNLEVIKYDLNAQIDSVMKNLQIEYEGKKMNLFDFIDADFSILAKKIEANNELTQVKLDSLMKNLFVNNQNTKEIHQALMILFDRMEKANPKNKEFADRLRTDTDRLFAGIGKGLMPSSGSIILAIATQNYAYLLTAIVPMLMSIKNEFNKGGRNAKSY